MADIFEQRRKVGRLVSDLLDTYDMTAVVAGRVFCEQWGMKERTAAETIRAFSKGYPITRFLKAEAEERGDRAYTRKDTQKLRDIFSYFSRL